MNAASSGKEVFYDDSTDIGIFPPNCIFNSAIVLFAASSMISSYFALFYSLTFALFLILLARYPNRNVLRVSLSLYVHIEQLIINVVLLLPPRDSWRILVNLESR